MLQPIANNPTISQLQEYVRAMKSARGFHPDVSRDFIRLTMQVGQLADKLRETWVDGTPNSRVVQTALGEQLADITLFVADLANQLNVDLNQAIQTREASNNKRQWKPINLV